jgi:hypothetical protein
MEIMCAEQTPAKYEIKSAAGASFGPPRVLRGVLFADPLPMTKPQRLALGIACAGALCAVAASRVPSLAGAVALWWIALACALVTGAYAFNLPEAFGKRDGKLSIWRALALLPYLVALRIACALMRWWRRLPVLSQVVPGVYVGGRLDLADLPPDTALIVDLMCEFSEPRAVRAHPGYRCHPVLDGAAPPEAQDEALLALLDEVKRVRGAAVIHCESGKGRAPSVAALALIARGLAPDLETALAMVRAGRPCASPTAVDHRFMQRIAERLAPAAVAPAERVAYVGGAAPTGAPAPS